MRLSPVQVTDRAWDIMNNAGTFGEDKATGLTGLWDRLKQTLGITPAEQAVQNVAWWSGNGPWIGLLSLAVIVTVPSLIALKVCKRKGG